MTTAGIRLEASTTGNVVKENVLNGNSVDVEKLGTGNIVKENLHQRTLRCP